MKIGLFGGSFNPVHRQHLRIAETVAQTLALDEVRFLPVFQPVHKHSGGLLPFEWRCRLLQAALKGHPGLRVDETERELGGASYTIRTVRHLKERHPRTRFWLIIGADSLVDLPHWREHESLIREIPLAVVARPGSIGRAELSHPGSRWVDLVPDGVSSSDIRRRVTSRRFPVEALPAGVAGTIAAENYYGCWVNGFERWIPAVRERLRLMPDGLLTHVEGVARLAAEYAAELGADPRAGYLAGLSHDLFRHGKKAEIAKRAADGPFRLTPLEREEPMLAHGAAAAAFLAGLSPKVPATILTAVRWHTFPRGRAGKLEQALIMGDGLDPSRGDPILDEVRETSLDATERFRRVVEHKRERASRKDQSASGTRAGKKHAIAAMEAERP